MKLKTKKQLEQELLETKKQLQEAAKCRSVTLDLRIDSRGQWYTPDRTGNTQASVTIMCWYPA